MHNVINKDLNAVLGGLSLWLKNRWQAYPQPTFRASGFLVRADFNVPLDDQGNITDDTRIRAALPTIQDFNLAKVAKLFSTSHFGRPKGKVVDSMRLTPVAKRLSELLGQEVVKCDDCIGDEVAAAINGLADGQVALLENVRFYAGEEANDSEFAKQLAANADLYVNDAFGTAHRAHASTAGVTEYLSPSVAGYLIEKELEYLQNAIENPPASPGSDYWWLQGIQQNRCDRNPAG